MPKSIGLLFECLGEERKVGELSDEDPESVSELSDVEKSVTSELRDEEGGLAILTCAVGPLLSINFQRPRS